MLADITVDTFHLLTAATVAENYFLLRAGLFVGKMVPGRVVDLQLSLTEPHYPELPS